MTRTKSTQHLGHKSNQKSRHASLEFESIHKENVRQAARRRRGYSHKSTTPSHRKEEKFWDF